MISIQNKEMDVDAKHPADINNANNNPLATKAVAESTNATINGVSTANLVKGKLLLAKELKGHISFKALLEADGHKFKSSGRYFMCRCPFHADSTPSFSIRMEDDAYGKCYGCDWYGDIFKYEMDFHRVDFKEAWWRLNDFFNQYPRAGRKAKLVTKKVKEEQPQLSEKQLSERKQYANRLAADAWIAKEICRKRFERSGEEWNYKTIQKLGAEGSLGWAGDALAFIYPTGAKYRKWPEKDFYWECEGISLWREHLLATAKHVYLTESETDAIALIHAGIENKAGCVVIAAPSATSFMGAWAPLFKEKVVSFCFDNDEAGDDGVKRIALLLQPYATELRTVDLKEAA